MKNYVLAVIGLLACTAFLMQDSAGAASTPKDISGHQYRESIQYLYDHGVVQGYPDGTFGPDRVINRAEIMKIIVKSNFGEDIGSGSKCFPDVQDERFASFVCYAKSHDIVKGYADGTFKPTQDVLIAEALKMAIETFGKETTQASSKDPWYRRYVDFAHNNTIFSQYTIRPTKNMTRGQMAYLIHQLMMDKDGSKPFDGVRDVASAGCGKTPPSKAPTSSVVNGVTRNYITVIGNKYNKDTPIKLIFAFHGRTNSNAQVQEYYDIDEESNGNAIIVYPSGLPEANPPRNWSNPGDKASKLRDFALFDQLLQEFETTYCINQDEIFVVGHSLGARFTNSLSYARGGVIRAVGDVGGGTTINTCDGPVAGMIMQNPEDNLSPLSAAITARDQMLEQNGCSTMTEPFGSVGNCVKYLGCQKEAPVIRCPYTESTDSRGKYYPHLWPEYAGKTIMDFFEGL